MDEICRLCCSTKFVNNSIFDEENALYLKMSLYLPIKVFKNDQLPQKVCDKCSCKVNDFYQFCNETIEVQNRLRAVLLSSGTYTDESVDLTRVKQCQSPPPCKTAHCERSTQTDCPHAPYDSNVAVEIKEEPNVPLSPVKKEEENNYSVDSDHFDDRSSDSEDVSLINLKKKKSKKAEINGEVTEKRGRKKKANLKDWEVLMKSLPDATLSLVSKEQVSDTLNTIKEELDEPPALLQDLDSFHCCICFIQCFRRSDMLEHYSRRAARAARRWWLARTGRGTGPGTGRATAGPTAARSARRPSATPDRYSSTRRRTTSARARRPSPRASASCATSVPRASCICGTCWRTARARTRRRRGARWRCAAGSARATSRTSTRCAATCARTRASATSSATCAARRSPRASTSSSTSASTPATSPTSARHAARAS